MSDAHKNTEEEKEQMIHRTDDWLRYHEDDACINHQYDISGESHTVFSLVDWLFKFSNRNITDFCPPFLFILQVYLIRTSITVNHQEHFITLYYLITMTAVVQEKIRKLEEKLHPYLHKGPLANYFNLFEQKTGAKREQLALGNSSNFRKHLLYK